MGDANAGCLAAGLEITTDNAGNRSVEGQPDENLSARANDTALAIKDLNTGNADPVKVEATINTLVKDLGLDETCEQEAKTSMTNELTATDSFAVAAGLWGVAAGGVSTTSARNNIDRHMRSKGCEPVMVKVRNVMNTQKNITCSISKKTSTEVVNVTVGQAIVFTINGEAKGSQAILAEVNASREIALLKESDNRRALGTSRLPDNLLFKLVDASLEATAALNVPGWGLPQIDIENFDASNSFEGNIIKVSQINFDTDIELKRSVIQGAQMEAETKLKESLGVDTLPPAVKSISDEKINNYFETNSTSLAEEANASSVSLDGDQNINVNFNGNVKLRDFNLSNTSEVEMKIETLVGMSSKIADEISTDMINLLTSKEEFETRSAGLPYDAIMATMGENNANLRAENARLSENVMGGLAGLVPPFGLLMLIPLIIPLAGLFFFKSTVSTFLSPTVIKILMVVLVLFIIWVIVGKFIGGESETRRFPSSTHEMKKYNSHLLDRHRHAHTVLRRAGDGELTRDEFSKGIAILTSDSERAAAERANLTRRLDATEQAVQQQRGMVALAYDLTSDSAAERANLTRRLDAAEQAVQQQRGMVALAYDLAQRLDATERDMMEQRAEVARAVGELHEEIAIMQLQANALPRKRSSSNNVKEKAAGPEMRRYGPEKMNVSDVSNNLGYQVTSTKGKKRAQPYQNVTFAPQGAWTIRSN